MENHIIWLDHSKKIYHVALYLNTQFSGGDIGK